MSGQSSEQRPGERPRPRLGWGQGLVAFERVKPKDEEEQVSSARRSSGADVGPESVGVSPAVSEDKSAAHTVEPEGGVVNSVQKHPEESSGAPLVEVAVAESNHKPVVPSPATPDSGKLVDLLLKSAVSDALALNGEANAPKTQPAQVFPLEPQAPTAKAEMVTPKVGKSSPWPQSLSALTEKEGPVKPESTAWPQSLSALTEKEGVAKPREAAPKEVPVPSAELVPATTEATPAVKVSPWPQSLSAAMGLVPAPEGLAPIKTLRLEEQLAAGLVLLF